MVHQEFGFKRLATLLEAIIRHSPCLHNMFYAPWLRLTPQDKKELRANILWALSQHLFDNAFGVALAQDIIVFTPEGTVAEIKTDSQVYQYLKKHVYWKMERELIMALVEAAKR